MSCNYCYHPAEDHDPNDDCGDGMCRRCAAKREEARRDRLAFLQTPRGRGLDNPFSGLEQADMRANESLLLLLNDRRMLLEEVARLNRELADARTEGYTS